MGQGKGSAPKPTDPKDTASAALGTNLATAKANAFMQNMNEYTPDGSRVVEQSGTRRIRDPFTGETYTVPTFDVRTELSEANQGIYDTKKVAEQGLADLAVGQIGQLGEHLSTPFSYGPGAHEAWAGGLYEDLNADKIARAREAQRASLVNQGLTMGTEAYDNAMQSFDTAQMDARNRFMLDSFNTGRDTAMTERNQPLNEAGAISGLMGGTQVGMPRFSGQVGVQGAATPDVASMIANADSQNMQAWQANQASQGSLLSGLGGLATGVGKLAGAGGFAALLSDERAKTDKQKIAETKDGLGIFSYRYKGKPETHIGLMAQEVEKKRPGAVRTGFDGLKRVNYKTALGG